MRKLLPFLMSLLLALPAAAQSFGGLLQSLSNALGGSKQPAEQQNAPVTATLGVRGMDDGTADTGAARPEELKRLDGWASTKPQAEKAAAKRGLVANPAASYGDTANAASGGAQ